MKRWIPVLLIGMMIVSTAGACDPPPPSGWVPPTLQSAAVSTNEIVAGTTFTVSVAATDDHQISNIGLRFLTRRAVDPLRVPCEAPVWQPGPVVSVDYVCTMPEIAANGDWTLTVLVFDGEWSGPHGQCGCDHETLPLTVTGGSEDGVPPVMDSAVTSPDPIPVGSPSVVTVRMSDDHLGDYSEPVYLQYDVAGGNPKTCTQTSQTRVSPTQHEWTFDCPPHSTPGSYLALASIRDAMGYFGEMRFNMDVVAAV